MSGPWNLPSQTGRALRLRRKRFARRSARSRRGCSAGDVDSPCMGGLRILHTRSSAPQSAKTAMSHARVWAKAQAGRPCIQARSRRVFSGKALVRTRPSPRRDHSGRILTLGITRLPERAADAAPPEAERERGSGRRAPTPVRTIRFAATEAWNRRSVPSRSGRQAAAASDLGSASADAPALNKDGERARVRFKPFHASASRGPWLPAARRRGLGQGRCA